MTISQQHFDALNAMGIPLWQRRSIENNISNDLASDSSSQEKYLAVDFATLCNQNIFLDILAALDLTTAEVKALDQTIDLGFINWHFGATDEISLSNGNLITPPIENIAQSPSLKRALWSVISEHGASI